MHIPDPAIMIAVPRIELMDFDCCAVPARDRPGKANSDFCLSDNFNITILRGTTEDYFRISSVQCWTAPLICHSDQVPGTRKCVGHNKADVTSSLFTVKQERLTLY